METISSPLAEALVKVKLVYDKNDIAKQTEKQVNEVGKVWKKQITDYNRNIANLKRTANEFNKISVLLFRGLVAPAIALGTLGLRKYLQSTDDGATELSLALRALSKEWDQVLAKVGKYLTGSENLAEATNKITTALKSIKKEDISAFFDIAKIALFTFTLIKLTSVALRMAAAWATLKKILIFEPAHAKYLKELAAYNALPPEKRGFGFGSVKTKEPVAPNIATMGIASIMPSLNNLKSGLDKIILKFNNATTMFKAAVLEFAISTWHNISRKGFGGAAAGMAKSGVDAALLGGAGFLLKTLDFFKKLWIAFGGLAKMLLKLTIIFEVLRGVLTGLGVTSEVLKSTISFVLALIKSIWAPIVALFETFTQIIFSIADVITSFIKGIFTGSPIKTLMDALGRFDKGMKEIGDNLWKSWRGTWSKGGKSDDFSFKKDRTVASSSFEGLIKAAQDMVNKDVKQQEMINVLKQIDNNTRQTATNTSGKPQSAVQMNPGSVVFSPGWLAH